MKPKLIRITTVPISMNIILRGQLAYMDQFFEVVGITSPDQKHLPEIEEREGIRVEGIRMHRGIALFQDLRSLFQLILCIYRERPVIVHTHTPKAGLLGMISAWILRVPIRIHTVAGLPLLEARGSKRKLLAFMESLTYRLAVRVYPNSYGLRSILIEEGLGKSEKLQVIGKGSSNGIDIAYFDPFYNGDPANLSKKIREKYDIKENCFVFTFVGRLAKEKGIEELLEAFLILYEQYSHVRLFLVGPLEKENGPISEEAKAMIEDHPAIIYDGRKDDIRPFLLAGDCFVFPSYREGFPNVLLQAGAMGLPSLASDINGCNEIIRPPQNGLLFKTKGYK